MLCWWSGGTQGQSPLDSLVSAGSLGPQATLWSPSPRLGFGERQAVEARNIPDVVTETSCRRR